MQICHQVIKIAEEAGEKILGVYKKLTQGEQILQQQKKDHSPVTEADLLAHQLIENALIQAFPEIPILSEEQKEIPYEIRQKWAQFWLVDPLDGTKDFLAQNDEFTVNIALIEKTVPILGVIHLPALEWTFFAKKGHGAFLKTKEGIQKLPGFIPEKNSILVSRFHETESMAQFIQINQITKMTRAGSALKFGKVALGEAMFYPRFVGSSEWDIAAGQIIVTESGGYLIDLSTKKPPIYNKPSLRNAFFIAGASESEWEKLMIPKNF